MKRSVTAVGISLLSSGLLYAQTSESAAPVSKKSSNRLLEEVMVTAQKREENSQDVPISISAFSGEKLNAFGVENTADLARITPGLTFTFTYGYTLIYLRGVGTDAFLPSADPSVATYIDGINIPSSQGKNDTLGPVERVEVLKGPQGTLFGRNSTGGAINIVTANPPEQFVGSVNAEYGVYDLEKLGEDVEKASYSLYMGAPITDDIGFTLAYFEELPMLMGKNTARDGGPAPERDDFTEGYRLKLRWDITDNFSATLVGSEIHQFNGNSLINENTRPSALLAGGYEADEADYNWHNDIQGGNETKNKMIGAIFEWSPGPVDFKFIYSDNAVEIPYAAYDYDSTENNQATFFTFDQFNEQKTYELQALSNSESWMADKLEWVAGLYRLEAEGGFGRLFFTANAAGFGANVLPIGSLLETVPPVNNTAQAPEYNVVLEAGSVLYTEADSAFFQGTWTFNEEWDLTLGARYQTETRGIRDAFLDQVNGTSGEPSDPYYRSGRKDQNVAIDRFSVPDVTEETISPRVAVQYRPTITTQIYASASQGFKSPTYNTINFFSDPDLVEKETATAVELGIKSELFDDSLRLNAAVFKTDIKNILTAIVSLTSGGVVRFQNAGRGEIEGAEFDFQWQPMADSNPGLAVTGSATYLDAVYTEYTNGAGFDDDDGLYFGPDTPTGGDTSRDFSGNDIVRTPDISYSMAINQMISMGEFGDLELGVDYYYNGGYNTTPQNSPFYVQEAYDLWNARLSYFYEPYGLQITAFGSNILNEEYYGTILQQDFGRTVVLAPPRLLGMRVKWDFDRMFY